MTRNELLTELEAAVNEIVEHTEALARPANWWVGAIWRGEHSDVYRVNPEER